MSTFLNTPQLRFLVTSISDIVDNAGVAKGTFYLYFKDKYDIRNKLIAHKSGEVFCPCIVNGFIRCAKAVIHKLRLS